MNAESPADGEPPPARRGDLLRDDAFMLAVLDSMAARIAVIDAQGRIVGANRTWLEFAVEHGLSGAGVGGDYLALCAAGPQATAEGGAATCAGLRDVLAGRCASFIHDYPCHLPDRRRWFSLRATPIEPGGRGAVVAHVDVTPRLLAEESLREKERLLADSQALAHVGSWILDVASETVSFSREGRRLLGLDDTDEGGLDFLVFLRCLHPEDRRPLQGWALDVLAGRAAGDIEFRVGHDGEPRWLLGSGGLERGEGGHVLMVGTLQDITDRKRVERELRIAATAFESQDGMVVTDRNQLILKVNQAFTRITGYSELDVLGRTPAMLKSGRHDAAFYQAMWTSLEQHRFWQGEVWNRRKSREVYPQWLRITAVTDRDGVVTNYVGAFSDISQYKQAEATIHNLAFYDALTGLPNRRLLMDRLKQTALANARRKFRGAILIVDLDGFKLLNDTRGYDSGDRVLVEIARRIQHCIHPDDTLARLGSDEFVVVLDALSVNSDIAARQARGIAERIHAAIKLPLELDGNEHQCKACIGISLFSGDEVTVEEPLRQADVAMYQAKEGGPDRIHFFDAAMQSALEERLLLERWLQSALPEQFRLHFQPQCDAAGRVVGAEVLLRWQHPERGMISPGEFIPLAEETGLILSIGRWVLECACRQLAAWAADARFDRVVLSVNVSARQFRQRDFVCQVQDALAVSGADPRHLKLELTESTLAENIDGVVEKMLALKAGGVQFALDDFGTGFSSLAYLKRLPLDELKIDQSFVRDLLDDPNDAAIVRTVIALGQSLGLAVIAEGVETEAQRHFLARHGCRQYQGYLFGAPMSLAEFEGRLDAPVHA